MSDEYKKFIEKSNLLHENKYSYILTNYVSSQVKVVIICPIHGEFLQTPSNHLQGQGCKCCSNDRKRLTTNEFIKRAIKVHGLLYNYAKSKYTDSHHKISIECNIHGEFLQTANDHLSGYGCSRCSNNKQLTTGEFIKKSVNIHGYTYDYSHVNYKNNFTKVKIICKKHGSFSQTPTCHMDHKQGCPKCKMSKGEEYIKVWLENNNISYIHQKTFDDCINPITNNKLKYDFYIPSKNLLIEFDGKQHFVVGSVMSGQYIITQSDIKDIQYRDKLKKDYAKYKNITLINIPYTNIKSIPDILDKVI